MDAELSELEVQLAGARDAFASAKQELVSHLGNGAEVAADHLISLAEEFGRDHALDVLRDKPESLGITEASAPNSQTSETLEKIAELQDKLDALSLEHDRLGGQDKLGLRSLDIQGEHFVIDGEAKVYFAADRPGERAPIEENLSPTQKAARDAQVSPAQPKPEQDRERGRRR